MSGQFLESHVVLPVSRRAILESHVVLPVSRRAILESHVVLPVSRRAISSKSCAQRTRLLRGVLQPSLVLY
jgi:hypothetical protein